MSELISDLVVDLDGGKDWSLHGSQMVHIAETIPDYFLSKGYHPDAIKGLAKESTLGTSLDTLLLGNHDLYGRNDDTVRNRVRVLNIMTSQSYLSTQGTVHDHTELGGIRAYTGTLLDQRSILRGLTVAAKNHEEKSTLETQRQFRRNGASRNLWLPNIDVTRAHRGELLSQVPIAIVGAGASGVLAAAYLSEMGFGDITLLDKRGKMNGLWKQSNVADGSKNNPFPIQFQSITANAFGRRIEGSGRDIDDFLEGVSDRYHGDRVTLRKANVKSIEPGDLNHRITLVEDGEEKVEHYPIVIYAPGIGSPLEPSDPTRMTTPHQNGEVGQRWQRQLSIDDLRDAGRTAIVGLGNSTAEIVHQMQQYEHLGSDYRIITHRSLGSLLHPEENYDGESIYRDVTKPDLVKLAGDLPHIKKLFEQARNENKIVTNVRHWQRDGNILTTTDADGIETRIPFDRLFTLIGYGQKQTDNEAMGLHTLDKRTGSIAYDYDGEVQRAEHDPHVQQQRERVHAGYFALGPILKNKHNPNAIVIPGIQHQLQFLTGTLLTRAAEVVYTQKASKVSKFIRRSGAVALAGTLEITDEAARDQY